jgi:hypothetical protein
MSSMIVVNLPVQYAAALAVVMLVALCAAAGGDEFAGREKLRAHSNEFRKEVIRVTDGVHLAVGYSAANVILIQGDGGSIIVDTGRDTRRHRAEETRVRLKPILCPAETPQGVGRLNRLCSSAGRA